MASGALTLAFACGALAVAMVLRRDTPAKSEQPFIGPLPPMPHDSIDDADYKWMENPGVVEMPTKRQLGELLNTVKALYPDGEVWEQVKYLDIDHSDPNNLKFDYNMRLFKNATKLREATQAPRRKLQQNIEQVPPDDVGKLDVMRQMLWALCAIDASQIISSIGQIVINIRTVTKSCKNPYPYDAAQQDSCAAMVQLNLAIWGYIAIYIEDMVNSCGPTFNVQAGCAIDLTGFMANAALVGAAGANMRSSCLPKHGYWEERIGKIEGNGVVGAISKATETNGARNFAGFNNSQIQKVNEQIKQQLQETTERQDRFRARTSLGRGFRRLDEETAELATLPADPVSTQQANAESDVETMQHGAAHILKEVVAASDAKDKEFIEGKVKHAADRMGLTSDEIYDYKNDVMDKRWMHVSCGFDLSKAVARLAQMATLIAMSVKDCGEHNFEINGHQGKTKCAIDVTGAIASAGIAAGMITISAINCPAQLVFTQAMGERLCAAAVIDLVSAATYIGTSIASVQSTCGSMDNYPGVPGT
ncbi:unnamed protein product [Symbiodinium sp. KB8]|nr:unnamed protein product [Symbiodinium sp. KB8]